SRRHSRSGAIIVGRFCETPRLLTQTPYKGRLRSIAPTSRFGIVLDQSIRHAVSVFAENAFTFNTVDVAPSLVVAGLTPRHHVFAVTDLRLTVHDRAAVKPRGQQIARIHVTARADLRRAVGGWILVRR